jgi:hypothetical protein
MTDSEKRKERRDQVARYRVMEQETTDPLAAGLLRDIVLELEAEMDEERTAPCDSLPEPGMIEFHGPRRLTIS